MRVSLFAVCSLLLLAGCRTPREGSMGPVRDLTAEEEQFAEALAHYAQGLIFENEIGRDAPQTLDSFMQAIELDPKTHKLYSKAALTALHQRDTEKAIEILERSCAENPLHVQAHVDLAITYQITGNLDKAIDAYLATLEIAPKQTFLYLALSRLYFHRKEDTLAVRVLREAVRSSADPDQAVAFCARQARSFMEAQEPRRAVQCFELVAKQASSQRREIYHLVAELHTGLEDYEAAKRAFKLAIKEDPSVPDSYVRLAMIQLRSDPDEAIRTLETARETSPESPSVLFPLAFAYTTEKRYEEAIPLFTQVQALSKEGTNSIPLSPSFYLHYGSACERAGHIEQAEALFEACIKIDPENHEVLNYLSYMLAERKEKLDTAMKYVTRALALEPENGAYIDTLGWIYYGMGQHEEALSELLKADRVFPSDPTINDHIGDALNSLGRTEEAVAYWKESFLLDPTNEAVVIKLKSIGVSMKDLRREHKRRQRQADAATTAD